MGAGALIVAPADAPLVVLIHGLGGSHHTWDRVLPLIEPHARVHALNLTGTGSIEQEAVLAAELIHAPRCSSATPAAGWSRPQSRSDTEA